MYGGKADQDINIHNRHTVKKLKMVSLYDFMLESFKHKGHCVVMDSAYMSDAMAQIGRNHWGINMVGTCQSDRTGAGKLGKAAVKAKEVVIGSHESLICTNTTPSNCFILFGRQQLCQEAFEFPFSSCIKRWDEKEEKRQTNQEEGQGI